MRRSQYAPNRNSGGFHANQVPGLLGDIWNNMDIYDKTALATAPVPVAGDITGLLNDLRHYYNNPDERTWGNYGLTAIGLLPFVPPVAGITSKISKSKVDKLAKQYAKEFKGKGKISQYLAKMHAGPRVGGRYPDANQIGLLEPEPQLGLLPSPDDVTPKNAYIKQIDAVGSTKRLKNSERKALKALAEKHDLSKAEVNDLTDRATKYRRTYRPDRGFQDVEFNFTYNNGKADFTPKSVAGKTGFTFSRDPSTGKPLTGIARQQRVDELSNELVRDLHGAISRGDDVALEMNKARKWYRNVRSKLRETYGGFGDEYADFQAAGSPNTALPINYKQSDEFFNRFISGDFDDKFEKIGQHLKSGGTFDNIPDNLLPRKTNGTRFGANTRKMIQVVYGDFAQDVAGGAPKMRNYARNLIGAGNDPTIDVWAARHVQRLSGEPLPPPAMSSVRGSWTGTGIDDGQWAGKVKQKVLNEGDNWIQTQGMAKQGDLLDINEEYGMGSDVYKAATEKLRQLDPATYGDLNPDDLQAMGWIQEKMLWENKGWTAPMKDAHLEDLVTEGAKGTKRYQGGISATQASDADVATQEAARIGLLEDLPGARAMDTQGVYMGYPEKSFDLEAINPDVNQMYRNVGDVSQKNNQWDAFVSEVTQQPGTNTRPGVEVYWQPNNPVQDQAYKMAQDTGIDGWTMIKDTRGNSVGMRSQYIPEFNDAATLAKLQNNPGLLQDALNSWSQNAETLTHNLRQIPGVSYAEPTLLNTDVFSRNAVAGPQYLWQPQSLKPSTGSVQDNINRALFEKFGLMGMPARMPNP